MSGRGDRVEIAPVPVPADLASMPPLDLRAALDALLADYVYVLDEDVLDQWPDFFVDDCLYKIIPRENFEMDLPLAVLSCEGRGMLMDRVTAIRETLLFEPRALRHITSGMRVSGIERDGSVRVQTNYVVYENTADETNNVFSVGRYLDRVVSDDGRLKYAEKLCVFDTSVIDTSLIYPI